MGLGAYRRKRTFSKTTEPKGKQELPKKIKSHLFVVQKHDASHLHYDFRMAIGKALKSWAIPKGPTNSTKSKRLAILTEDHPMEYANFEGIIPKGNYGAGVVMVWDKGSYKNLKKDKAGKEMPIEDCFKKGRIEIFLKGKKMKGAYALVRFRGKNWLMVKMKDDYANSGPDLVKTHVRSVKSNRTMHEIKKSSKES